ncbi:hypothetical protein EI976_05315 [Bacillus licheniformis]|uniref:hypothetical protein n=1 Tax=Bacillus licheniformis TaxID=1402 RepID=UPI00035F73E2|nr:hypothetical protein [Bacillus licheniformis]AYC51950.1 hypothetical protein C7M53_11865 [Bacillus licheniformis]KAA0813090.1 hypothetical protein EI978_07995 [Bacillus licheniformis]KAA0821279.1 hypothetical protein EI973_19005 [Bacillus licheniformis]KAA0826461.1 hypothetical protein EI976_05315 [Bacillus licheniformis]MBU8781567.1 hypothetical protein [Bacillus licheniformis]
MARRVKCPYCETYLDKDDAIPYKKRYYHQNCFDTWKMEAVHRKELIKYICELYKIDAPTGMMLKQIKEFQEEYKYKLKGIELALRYFHETLGNPVREGDGLGIVPFIYEEAKADYLQKKAIEESVEEAKKHKQKESIVIIKKQNRKNIKIVDISTL